MEETLDDSKSFTSTVKLNKISCPWRDKKLKKQFRWTEFVNPKLKKITLENKKERTSYVMN